MSQPVDSREVRESASEVKFLLDGDLANRIRNRVRALLAPDTYASGPTQDEYATTTIYFDTTDFDVYPAAARTVGRSTGCGGTGRVTPSFSNASCAPPRC